MRATSRKFDQDIEEAQEEKERIQYETPRLQVSHALIDLGTKFLYYLEAL